MLEQISFLDAGLLVHDLPVALHKRANELLLSAQMHMFQRSSRLIIRSKSVQDPLSAVEERKPDSKSRHTIGWEGGINQGPLIRERVSIRESVEERTSETLDGRGQQIFVYLGGGEVGLTPLFFSKRPY